MLTPEIAKAMTDYFLEGIRRESVATKKVIAAIPADQSGYKPADKCMCAEETAWHTVSSEVDILNAVAAGNQDNPVKRPESVKTPADIASWYEQELPKAIAAVAAMSGEELASPVTFYGVFTLPRVGFVDLARIHAIHHRGQLSAYLRPMGAKVPAIYGGSADEAFGAGA